MTASHRRRRRATESFYALALAEADRDVLEDARAVTGLDEEVALLRVQLRQALERQPEDWRVLQGGVRLLVQALLAQRRLSPEQADDLGEAIATVLEQFGDVLKGD